MSYSLKDYLEIDPATALRQWNAVSRRLVPQQGARQEPFRPIEVILCFALFRIVDPNAFGGGNRHRIPAEVQAIATSLRRSPMSLLYKMQNLTAALPHGAKQEPEVFLRLSQDPSRFSALYRTVLMAAERAGFDRAAVPDVIGMVDEPGLVGQEEIGSNELGLAHLEYEKSDAGRFWRAQFSPQETEKLIEARVRIGQDRFARRVLADYEHQCAFCGFHPVGLPPSGLLVASHIKPWSKCDKPGERLDPSNGIAACPIHDRAFDAGLITVNGGHRIHRTGALELLVSRDEAAKYFFGSAVMQERLLVPAGSKGPGRRYLDYHKEHVFRGVG